MSSLLKGLSLLLLCISLQGCGTVISLATDTAIAVVKVPFKVAGAVIEGVAGDDDDDDDDDDDEKEDKKETNKEDKKSE